MIQCVDIGNLEIRDMNLKESKREFIDILHELGHGYNEKEWHLLKIYRILIQYEMKSSELLKFISFRSRFTHLLYWMILKEKVL